MEGIKYMDMITRETMDALRERYVNARNGSEQEAVRAEISRLCDEDAETVAKLTLEQVKETKAEVSALRVKEQLAEISPMVSLAYIARTYFHKSRAWLYQRINGLKVNGKPAEFTPQEIETLNYALKDIGGKLTSVSIS